ncbi:MAG: hypothetical protein WBL45_13165 [Solirubrobacterales bacterium]
MDLAEWVAAGQNLGAMSRCSQWWLGDWIRYGNTKFGERYSRATAITGYDAQSLMNMVWVASTFEISRRREMLSWSHHEAVASLDAQQQERWLDLAGDRRLSVADVRTELRAARKGLAQINEEETEIGFGEEEALICPRCGGVVPVAAAPRDNSSAK